MSNSIRPSGHSRLWLWAIICLVILLHSVLVAKYLGHPVEYDELYHMLSADSWQESGQFAILDGEYTRGRIYTALVGVWTSMFSDSISTVRLSSLLFSALLLLSVILYTASRINLGAATIAGVLLALAPPVVDIAYTIRFYSLHAFTLFIFAILTYDLLTYRRSTLSFSLLILLALALLGLSLHLQITTLVGLLGIVTGALIITAPDWWKFLSAQSIPIRVLLLVLLIVVAGIGVYLLDPRTKYEILRGGPMWSAGLANNLLYYHHWLKGWYPALWPLMPFFLLAGLVKYPRAVLYFATIFLTGFAVMSIGATKAHRFIAFIMPYWSIAMGIGIAATLASLYRSIYTTLSSSGILANIRGSAGLASNLLIIAAILSFLSFQPLVRAAQRAMLNPAYELIYGSPSRWYDWAAATPHLQKLMESHPIVVTSTGVKAVYFLDNLTVDMNKSVMQETISGEEFGLDPRTGRLVIASPESMKKVIQTCGPGMVIIEEHHANSVVAVPAETIAVLDEMAMRLTEPSPGLLLWTWDDPAASLIDSTEDCLNSLKRPD